MILQCFILGIIFLGIGISFFIGKAIPMLKGWKKLSDEEKKKINTRLLGRNAGIILISAGIIFELTALIPEFQEKMFIWCMITWFIMAGIDVYHMERSKRYLLDRKEIQEV